MRRSIAVGMAWFAFLAGPGPSRELERVGRLDDPAIVEASGIVASRRHPGIFWVHNDSGNPPRLFAVRRDGSLVRSYRVEAANVDWEDIAIDDAGHLYIGDIGDNTHRLPIHAIYRVDEPDPSLPADKPLKPSGSWFFQYAGGVRVDAESLFFDRGRALVVSKRHDGVEAEVFAIRLDRSAPWLRPTEAERVRTIPGCVEPATGADLSADGKLLTVVTSRVARVYRAETPGEWSVVATIPFAANGVEAIAWDGLDLILASEDRSIYRIVQADWRGAAKVKVKEEGR